MNILCSTASYLGIYQCETPISMDMEQAFMNHVTEYGLMFATQDEYYFRLNLYAQKDAEINEINASQDSFVVGHN
jgi:hypothetical protein